MPGRIQRNGKLGAEPAAAYWAALLKPGSWHCQHLRASLAALLEASPQVSSRVTHLGTQEAKRAPPSILGDLGWDVKLERKTADVRMGDLQKLLGLITRGHLTRETPRTLVQGPVNIVLSFRDPRVQASLHFCFVSLL